MKTSPITEITLDVSGLPVKLVDGVMEIVQRRITEYRSKGVDAAGQSQADRTRSAQLRGWLGAFQVDAFVYLKRRREEYNAGSKHTAEGYRAHDRFKRQIQAMSVYTVTDHKRWDYQMWTKPGVNGLDWTVNGRPVDLIPDFGEAVDRAHQDGGFFIVDGIGKKTFDLVCGDEAWFAKQIEKEVEDGT